jgi:hypothetical protein
MIDLFNITKDRITGETAPCGRITGFQHAHIRANWPTIQATKPLTDRAIDKYILQGKYGPELQARASARVALARQDRLKARERLMMNKRSKNFYK